MELDSKQQRLIAGWMGRAALPDGDEYGRFMSAWIAFNAFCYALFAEDASKPRPDLTDKRGLAGLTGRQQVEGYVEARSQGRLRIRIEKPGRIQIDIRERYTEDYVFSEFGRSFQVHFAKWLDEVSFRTVRDEFLASLKRQRGTYVVNMPQASQYKDSATLEQLVAGNVVIAVNDHDSLSEIVDTLYQVRCNVFHGEKVPGELNDDRIVKTARPLVMELLQRALEAKHRSQ